VLLQLKFNGEGPESPVREEEKGRGWWWKVQVKLDFPPYIAESTK
jgi:hypothetical protein